MVGGSLPELRQEGAQPEVGRKKSCACTRNGGPTRARAGSRRVAAQPTPGGKRLDLVYMRAERAVETV